MNNLTLVIPAKNESVSLPIVLKELRDLNINKIVTCQIKIFYLLKIFIENNILKNK